MATVFDVADYILKQRGGMSAMKLQKLCYYSHAWHLVWEEKPLFPDAIEAWANGPVVRALYATHRGEFRINAMRAELNADAANLTPDEVSSIDAALEFYGDMSAHQLSELTHSERPWQEARADLAPGARGQVRITDLAMASYYDSLTEAATER